MNDGASSKTQLDAMQYRLAVTHALRCMFGDIGAAMRVDLIAYEHAQSCGTLRVESRNLCRLWSAITMLAEFERLPCQFEVEAVHGALVCHAVDSREFMRTLAQMPA
mmetsp:Transcript_36844/g.77640  ORF Transcript_36844/g.77640 Transcript_36844/m.77640 type:complete len:107 (+) Transcript_36844:1-321(+)